MIYRGASRACNGRSGMPRDRLHHSLCLHPDTLCIAAHQSVHQAGNHEAHCRQAHHGHEHVVVTLLPGEVIKNGAVTHVGKHAWGIADQAANTEGRSGNVRRDPTSPMGAQNTPRIEKTIKAKDSVAAMPA